MYVCTLYISKDFNIRYQMSIYLIFIYLLSIQKRQKSKGIKSIGHNA